MSQLLASSVAEVGLERRSHQRRKGQQEDLDIYESQLRTDLEVGQYNELTNGYISEKPKYKPKDPHCADQWYINVLKPKNEASQLEQRHRMMPIFDSINGMTIMGTIAMMTASWYGHGFPSMVGVILIDSCLARSGRSVMPVPRHAWTVC